MSTEENFKWLGLDRLVVGDDKFDLASLRPEKAYIPTNAKHSAFAYAGQYDELGTPTLVGEFVHNHSTFLTRLFGRREMNGVFRLQ